ncbi:MAG: bifunctional diaminohydroxyphosphoribosylaminopyrimidine deaminase/5-amino-6-(5-phosphoribosylamino)uracil reductase RibD [Candidatus Delongbacteria bacterium]
MTDLKKKYMRAALREAKKGAGKVSPNPLVGAVVVKDGNIIGKGYHKVFGENHAEINALDSCIRDPQGAEMYVNLEPCSHHGKTPPCVERIIKEKIKKVYIGLKDPSPHSNGKGIKILRKAGIEVETGVCEEESRLLNSVFLYSLKNDIPYIVLKAAISIDGCIATDKDHSKWITCDKSRKKVHRLRNLYDAVLVGKNTVPNPQGSF